MTTAKADGAGRDNRPAPGLSKTRSLGASMLTIRIYEMAMAAGEKGITVKELHQQLGLLPGFDSDTALWAWESGRSEDNRIRSGEHTIIDLGLKRVRIRVDNLVKQHILTSLKNTGGDRRYTTGTRPPQGYRRKKVEQPNWGFYPITAASDGSATKTHVAKVQWRERAQAELTNKNLPKRVRQVIQEAVDFMDADR